MYISTISIDTQGMVNRLIAAGFPPTQADAIAYVITEGARRHHEFLPFDTQQMGNLLAATGIPETHAQAIASAVARHFNPPYQDNCACVLAQHGSLLPQG